MKRINEILILISGKISYIYMQYLKFKLNTQEIKES